MTQQQSRQLLQHTPLLLLLLSLVAYIHPWSTSIINSLTLGAYDLAEWVNPLPTASLLLRLQLTLIALLFALSYRPKTPFQHGIWIVAILFLTIAQLPPLDFITRLEDANQRQQFILAAITLIGSFTAAWITNLRWRSLVLFLIVAAGIVTAFIGEQEAIGLMQQYQPQTSWGIGFPALIATYLLWIVWGYFWGKRNRITQ